MDKNFDNYRIILFYHVSYMRSIKYCFLFLDFSQGFYSIVLNTSDINERIIKEYQVTIFLHLFNDNSPYANFRRMIPKFYNKYSFL
jgi:hypothetical protein